MEVCEACGQHLQQAVALYRGDFMEGFTLPDSATFDEWQFFQAETLRGDLASALERLVNWHRGHEAYETAISLCPALAGIGPFA